MFLLRELERQNTIILVVVLSLSSETVLPITLVRTVGKVSTKNLSKTKLFWHKRVLPILEGDVLVRLLGVASVVWIETSNVEPSPGFLEGVQVLVPDCLVVVELLEVRGVTL